MKPHGAYRFGEVCDTGRAHARPIEGQELGRIAGFHGKLGNSFLREVVGKVGNAELAGIHGAKIAVALAYLRGYAQSLPVGHQRFAFGPARAPQLHGLAGDGL